MSSIKQALFLSLLTLSTALSIAAQGQSTPTASAPSWRTTPATPAGVNQRIEDAAVDNQDRAPIPRTVLYDIGYPASDEEFTALDGHAFVLLTALSQVRDELPLRRVFVLLEDGTETPLKQVKLVLSDQSAAGTLTAKVFGPYRSDSLYLLPVYLRLKPVELYVEFARGNSRLKVAKFGTGVSSAVSRLKIFPPTGVGPTEAMMNAFIKREFPGF